jgi:hypothetical protein
LNILIYAIWNVREKIETTGRAAKRGFYEN